MIKNHYYFLVLCFCLIYTFQTSALPLSNEKTYRKVEEVMDQLKKLERDHPEQIRLHNIATSPGGNPVVIAELGYRLKEVPAIFTGANFEGNVPLATEGALELISILLDSAKYYQGIRWYILPMPNPDALRAYFNEVKYERLVNDFTVNDDMDESVNEDGPEDLNKDGLITQMRFKDPEGSYRVSPADPGLMLQASRDKGERGEYKVYTEGLDNDLDGKYNEDGQGGINPGISFPHLFPYDKKEAGLFPGQTPEVYAIMKFVYDHPEIAMAFTLGSSDFCRKPPRAGRKGGVNFQSIKIPARFVRMFDVDPNQSFTIDQVIEMMKERFPAGTEVTPTMVAGFLGLGAAVNPLDEDMKMYTRLSEKYNKYLEGKSFSSDRLDAPADKDGSFELWAYYHLGIPSFSMNLFTIPVIKKEKTDTAGVSLTGETEKKNSIQPDERERALLAWSEKAWNGKGFVNWQKYNHPELGEVEIGGFSPYLETTPPPVYIDSLLHTQLPWLLQLSEKLPEISFSGEKITSLGSGVHRVELYIENKGELPWPISMGERNRQPAPVIIVIEGEVELLEGLKRTPLGTIGNNQVKKLTWLVKAEKNETITAIIESKVFGTVKKEIRVGG